MGEPCQQHFKALPNLPVKTVCGNAIEVDKVIEGQFNHILLMGPLYHLLAEEQRVAAVNAALNLLKPSGILFVSFITMMAEVIKAMRFDPNRIYETDVNMDAYLNSLYARKSFAGKSFTQMFFIEQSEILPFMEKFSLEKLHLFGQDGLMLPCENNIMSQPRAIIDSWLDMCEKLWDREELLSWSEHIMYVGKAFGNQPVAD